MRRPSPKAIAVIALWGALLLLSGWEGQAQTARGDTLVVRAGVPLTLPWPALLSNDDLGGVDSVAIEITGAPRHGSLEFGADGSLTYRPDTQYMGPDSITYRLRTLPIGTFEVDTTQSRLNFRAQLTLPNLGSASDESELRIAGTMQAGVWGSVPLPSPDSVEVTGLALTNLDAASLDFDYGDLGITVLTVSLDAAAGGIVLSMLRPGPAAIPGFAGLFTQDGNEIGVAGAVDVAGSGTLGGLVPASQESFDTSTTTSLTGIVAASSGGSRLILNVDLEESVDISGNTADLHITGEIVANGRIPEPAASNQAVVRISVVSHTAVEEIAGTPRLQVYPNPASHQVRIESDSPVLRAEVFDVLGRSVRVFQGDALDVSGLAPGAYWVRVLTARGVDTTPLWVR